MTEVDFATLISPGKYRSLIDVQIAKISKMKQHK